MAMCEHVAVDEEQAMTNVRTATRKYRTAQQRQEDAREQLAAAIREASAAGARQVDLVNATGYTREHIRRILKGD
jgi:activator of 2-hydroxyglutaryl-CoA dehydratase